jgi:threonine dehydrogenase-like Zn-dependent dehydrogenase
MKALIRNEASKVEIRDMPVPRLEGSADVRVDVKSAGICMTDLAILTGAFGGTTPRILGHEIAGEVREVGSAVKDLKPGDRVALQPTISCGECPACREGNWHLCPNRRFVGLDVDGGYADQMVVPGYNLVKIPAEVSFRHACMVEPVACVLHAVRCFGGLPRGVIITGAGSSAYLFAAVLVSKGVSRDRILVSGRRDSRLALMEDLGVHTSDARHESLSDKSMKVFGKRGPDILVDLTGDPGLLKGALDIVARKGTLFIYDFLGTEIPFHFGMLQLREITLRTSTGCPGTIPEALALMASGEIDVSPLITHVFPQSRMKEAFLQLTEKAPGHIKSVIEMGVS